MPSTTSRKDAARARAEVQKYFAKLPVDSRKHVKQLREIIRSVAPTAVDVISYGIAAFRLDGRILIWYAGWKNHCSLYPLTAADRRAAEKAGYKTAKGTVQFPNDDPIPTGLIRRLVKSRVAEVRKKSKA
jgi:uncharacterized protein YdhG (YjbR/CyaY superfamily)